MKRITRIMAALAAVVGLSFGSLIPAASAAPLPTAASSGHQLTAVKPYCAVVVSKEIDPRTNASRVISRSCSSVSLAAAVNQIPQIRTALAKAGIKAGDDKRFLATPNG